MGTDHPRLIEQLREGLLGQEACEPVLLPRGRLRTHGQDHASLAAAKGRPDAAQGPRDVAEVGQGLLGPRRGMVQPLEVFRPGQHLGRSDLVEVEILRSPALREIPPASQKSRHAQPLRHVLAGVPGVELGLSLRDNVMPDGHERCAFQAPHARLPVSFLALPIVAGHVTRARATRPPQGSDAPADASRVHRAPACAPPRRASPRAGNPRPPGGTPSAPGSRPTPWRGA